MRGTAGAGNRAIVRLQKRNRNAKLLASARKLRVRAAALRRQGKAAQANTLAKRASTLQKRATGWRTLRTWTTAVKAETSFRKRLALPRKKRLLPGAYRVVMQERVPGATPRRRTVRLKAPREGVVTRSFVATSVGGKGKKALSSSARPGIVFAHFNFVNKPKSGVKLRVRWSLNGRVIGTRPLSRRLGRLSISFLRNNAGALPPGRYVAQLRRGKVPMATTTIRVR